MSHPKSQGSARFRATWVAPAILALAAAACVGKEGAMPADSAPAAPESAYQRLRERMVAEQIRARGVRDPRVLRAMTSVARHRFVPEALRDLAYADRPLPIGLGQTISQPYIVALMTEALRPEPGDRVLEIGTGSGYQAAVLSVLVREVYTIEIVPELHATARRRLEELGYGNIRARSGDGYRGWPEAAPFDGILVTAAPGHVPPALVEQLRVGGRLVIPVGEEYQELRRIEKTDRGVRETVLLPVRFVPMTGEAQEPESGGNPPAEDPGGEDGEKHHPEG